MKIIVLGAGLVGKPMAIDLAKDNTFEITLTDVDEKKLSNIDKKLNIKTLVADLSDNEKLKKIVSNYDLVLNALPGFMGFQTLQSVIETGRNIVDISFFPEDPFVLDELAKSKGVTAIMDCGVAPGMSNILIGFVDHILDELTEAYIYVGGLPRVRQYPYEYKAVFSPVDVIEEYTRTARYVENGHIVHREALSDIENMDFEGIGTLESFNSDGLRSLIDTIKCPNMKEKTLRYPGHVEIMKILRETGFFSKDPIDIQGKQIRPLDFTSKLLFPKWELKPGEEDITIMRVIIRGIKNGRTHQYIYDLLDYYDTHNRVHSMARTTGYTATMAVRMIAKGLFKDTGLIVPEYIGKYTECVEFILKGLEERGIIYQVECKVQ